MKTIKALIRGFIPPIIMDFYKIRSGRYEIHGNYKTWDEAKKASTPYFTDYEKIGELDGKFEEGNGQEIWAWPLFSMIQLAAIENGNKVNVLDFGGGLGSSYFMLKKLLSVINSVNWSVVDLPDVVDYGKKHLEDDRLAFFNTIEEAKEKHDFNVLTIGSVLLYLDEPYQLVSDLVIHDFDYIVIDRTPFLPGNGERYMIQEVPRYLGGGIRALRLLSENSFMDIFKTRYDLIGEHIYNSSYPNESVNPRANYKCVIFRKKR